MVDFENAVGMEVEAMEVDDEDETGHELMAVDHEDDDDAMLVEVGGAAQDSGGRGR